MVIPRRRYRYLVGLALLLAALLPGVGLARAQVRTDYPTKVPLISHAHVTGVEGSDRTCAPPPPGVTQVAVKVRSVWGDHADDTMRGSNVTDACLYIAADGSMTATAEATFTGTVDGCGSGTLRFAVTGTLSAPDPATGARTSKDYGRFVPGSDTGFADVVAGNWTLWGQVAPDGTQTGRVRGTLACRLA